MLEKYGLLDAKSVSTPADPNVKLCKEDKVSKPVDSVMYQSMVGSLTVCCCCNEARYLSGSWNRFKIQL